MKLLDAYLQLDLGRWLLTLLQIRLPNKNSTTELSGRYLIVVILFLI